ncbi:MAG: hypothetical protein ACRCTZ_17905 [Sarcina sp.]
MSFDNENKNQEFKVDYILNSCISLPANFKRTEYFQSSKYKSIIYEIESFDDYDKSLVKFICKFIYSFESLKETEFYSDDIENYRKSVESFLDSVLTISSKVSEQEADLLIRSLATIVFPLLRKNSPNIIRISDFPEDSLE